MSGPYGSLRWREAALKALFPPCCAGCRRELAEQGLCRACQDAILMPASDLCQHCGGPLPRERFGDSDRCPRCQWDNDAFDQVITLGPYDGALRQMVLRTKHAVEHALTFELGRLLGFRWRARRPDDLPDRLFPVPMYWYRRWVRGINSAFVLAEGVADVLGRPLEPDGIRCCRWTQKQSMLTATERQQNIRGAFRVPPEAAIAGQHLGVVDDTMTTGATAQEIARLLKQLGAARVTVAVLSRATVEWKKLDRRHIKPR